MVLQFICGRVGRCLIFFVLFLIEQMFYFLWYGHLFPMQSLLFWLNEQTMGLSMLISMPYFSLTNPVAIWREMYALRLQHLAPPIELILEMMEDVSSMLSL